MVRVVDLQCSSDLWFRAAGSLCRADQDRWRFRHNSFHRRWLRLLRQRLFFLLQRLLWCLGTSLRPAGSVSGHQSLFAVAVAGVDPWDPGTPTVAAVAREREIAGTGGRKQGACVGHRRMGACGYLAHVLRGGAAHDVEGCHAPVSLRPNVHRGRLLEVRMVAVALP